jgi:hypothetical protein
LHIVTLSKFVQPGFLTNYFTLKENKKRFHKYFR